jgi:cell shape-determining protein MreC
MLIGAGLYFGPDGVADRIRGSVNDLLRPGLETVRLAKESLETSSNTNPADHRVARHEEVAELTEALALAEEHNRALQIRLAQHSEQRRQEQMVSPEVSKSQRLIQPLLVEVAVLGGTIAEDWCAGKLIDQGEKAGLRENGLVLAARKAKKTLIDVGQDNSISTEDTLLLGRCVIGKVEHVGRWTSTIQLVTDASYNGRAQIIRETSDGFVFDATDGIILKGQGGPLCKLEGIPAEKSVHIHDGVYTRERDGVMPIPLYYGEVVEASLEPNDREWTVLVRPAALPRQLTRIQVLRMVVNPDRLASK